MIYRYDPYKVAIALYNQSNKKVSHRAFNYAARIDGMAIKSLLEKAGISPKEGMKVLDSLVVPHN